MGSTVEVFIHGCDNIQTHTAVERIPWTEAGSRLSGVLAIPYSGPPLPDQPLVASTDIQISSIYDCQYVIEWWDSDGNHHEIYEAAPQTYCTIPLQFGFNVANRAEAQVISPENNYIWVPFWFDIPRELCQSTNPNLDPKKVNSRSGLFAGYIRHTLAIRTSIQQLGIATDWNTRDLLVLRPRVALAPQAVPTRQTCDQFKNTHLEIGPDAVAYMEGDQAGLAVRIELLDASSSSQRITDGTLKLIAKCETARFRFRSPYHMQYPPAYFHTLAADPWNLNSALRETITMKEEIAEFHLRGLNLLPGTTQNRMFSIGFLPTCLEYATMSLNYGPHFRTFSYDLKLHLDKPGLMNDIKVETSLDIYPNLRSRSNFTTLNPSTFVPETFPLSYCGLYKREFVLRVVRAEGLPKMDGLFGKADPYCTILLNDLYFRNTGIQKKTLAPEWNETFVFLFAENDFCRDMHLLLECWDYDLASKDDFIGSVSIVLKFETANMVQFQPKNLELQRPLKKGAKLEKTGTVSIEYQWK